MSERERNPGLRWWSVKLRVEEADLNEMSRLWAHDFAQGARHIVFGSSGSNPELEPPSLTFELQAADFADAEERARGFAHRMRKAAKLKDAVLPVVWLAPIGRDDASSRFLDQARTCVENEYFGLAVVAAQIHFEVQLRALLEEASQKQNTRWANRLLKERGVAELKRPWSLAAIELLVGVDVTQLPEWPRFQAHVERRNDVAHRGQTIEKEHAEDSMNVVQELWMTLTSAARQAL